MDQGPDLSPASFRAASASISGVMGHVQQHHREDDDQQDPDQRNDELDVLVEADPARERRRREFFDKSFTAGRICAIVPVSSKASPMSAPAAKPVRSLSEEHKRAQRIFARLMG